MPVYEEFSCDLLEAHTRALFKNCAGFVERRFAKGCDSVAAGGRTNSTALFLQLSFLKSRFTSACPPKIEITLSARAAEEISSVPPLDRGPRPPSLNVLSVDRTYFKLIVSIT